MGDILVLKLHLASRVAKIPAANWVVQVGAVVPSHSQLLRIVLQRRRWSIIVHIGKHANRGFDAVCSVVIAEVESWRPYRDRINFGAR